MRIIYSNKADKISYNLFTLSVSLSPLLRVYSSGISGIDLAELCLILSSLACVITGGTILITKKASAFCRYLVYLAITSIIVSFFVKFSYYDFLALFIRFGFYVFVLVLCSKCFIKDKGLKIVRWLAIISCCALLIQLISYYAFGKVLSLKLGFLQYETSDINYTGVFIKEIGGYFSYRATSFYIEPAHFAYVVCIALANELFLQKKSNYILALYTISIILSTSTGGILMMIAIWAFYYLNVTQVGKARVLLFGSVALGVALIVFRNSNILNFTILKMTRFFSEPNASSGRLSSMGNFANLPAENKLIGVGFGNAEFYFESILGQEIGYISSITGILLWTGIIGLIVIMVVLIKLFIHTDKHLRVYIAISIMSILGTAMMTSIYLFLFLLWPLYYESGGTYEST